jgi:hypothetical protein
MKIGLEEAIRHYDRENNRKSALESKASYLLGINAILMPIILGLILDLFIKKEIVIQNNYLYWIFYSLMLIIFIIILVVCFLCIKLLKVTDVYFPIDEVKDPKKLEKFFNKTDLEKDLFSSYSLAISMNNKINNEKVKILSTSFCLVGIYIILFFILFISLMVIR